MEVLRVNTVRQLGHSANCCFNRCAGQCHHVRKASLGEQLLSETIHPAMRAQLHLPLLGLSWDLSGWREKMSLFLSRLELIICSTRFCCCKVFHLSSIQPSRFELWQLHCWTSPLQSWFRDSFTCFSCYQSFLISAFSVLVMTASFLNQSSSVVV